MMELDLHKQTGHVWGYTFSFAPNDEANANFYTLNCYNSMHTFLGENPIVHSGIYIFVSLHMIVC